MRRTTERAANVKSNDFSYELSGNSGFGRVRLPGRYPIKLFKPLFLRFSKKSDNAPQARRLHKLLNLDPARYQFGIVDTADSGVERLGSESGKLSQVFEPQTDLAEVLLNNRSVMEVRGVERRGFGWG